jgi:hypothetical protein
MEDTYLCKKSYQIGRACNSLDRHVDTSDHDLLRDSTNCSTSRRSSIGSYSSRTVSILACALSLLRCFHHFCLDIRHEEELPQHLMS